MRTFILNAAATELFATLVPEVTVIEAAPTTSGRVLPAVSHSVGASCPRCQALSTRVPSYSTRRPHAVPICGQPLQRVLHLRRLRCLNPACSAVTFTERLPELIAPSAQRTARLNALLRGRALAFGGEAGARQRERSALPASGDPLLRRAHAATPPARPTPRVLGIDDFSFRKGQVFGTLRTDGESHAVVDLLPDRTADTAAAWLQKHAGAEIVPRDRGADYPRAISTGAPHAVQVADRFPRVKNAGETRERVVQRNHQGLRLAAKAMDPERTHQTATVVAEPELLPEPRAHSPPTTERPAPRSPAQPRRLARYQEVTARAADGLGPKAIAQRVGLTRPTGAIWLRASRFPERLPAAPRRMLITPYEP